VTKREEFGPTGAVVMEGTKATLEFRRRLASSPEVVGKALTDSSELSRWYMTKAVIDGREGGTIDFIAGPSRLHVTGRILTWRPPTVFEHEWKVSPRPELQSGEDAIIRWELLRDGEGTILHHEHSELNRETALGFAPGTHALWIDCKPNWTICPCLTGRSDTNRWLPAILHLGGRNGPNGFVRPVVLDWFRKQSAIRGLASSSPLASSLV